MATTSTKQDDKRAQEPSDPNLQEESDDGRPQTTRSQEPFDLHTAEHLGDLTEPPFVASHETHVNNNPLLDGNVRDVNLPLYKAVLNGDRKGARRFLECDSNAATARITMKSETVLHVAARAGHSRLVEELVELVSPEALALQDDFGRTALHYVAIAGITEAAKAMVIRNSALPQIRDMDGWTPVLSAAAYCGHEQKEMVWYLGTVTRDDNPSPFTGHLGAQLICNIVAAGFLDISLYLLQRYPDLATARDKDGINVLDVLAQKPSAFPSGARLGFWQRCIYSLIYVELDDARHYAFRGDMEDPPESSGNIAIRRVFQWLSGLLCNSILQLVPGMKQVHNLKFTHIKALELVRCICAKISSMNSLQIDKFFLESNMVCDAAQFGIAELILECFQSFPDLIWLGFANDGTIFHIAVKYRQENIFNLIYGTSISKKLLASQMDELDNTILHLAAKLPPSSQLKLVSSAALQMQRELQWFKEVEKIVRPGDKEMKNKDGKTARVLFTEEHEDLVEKGEKWMKDTSQSCMVVATLIATVVFAAAFTVPGGNISDSDNSDNGIPIFLNKQSFMLFAISDALALFSSSTSVLMFLSILTSRYAEEDFLKSLPKRLIIGLATLFFSIATMMIAFSAALSIVLSHKLAWVSIPIALFAGVPVTLFALLQFPLFVEIVRSTYGSGIFNRQSSYTL